VRGARRRRRRRLDGDLERRHLVFALQAYPALGREERLDDPKHLVERGRGQDAHEGLVELPVRGIEVGPVLLPRFLEEGGEAREDPGRAGEIGHVDDGDALPPAERDYVRPGQVDLEHLLGRHIRRRIRRHRLDGDRAHAELCPMRSLRHLERDGLDDVRAAHPDGLGLAPQALEAHRRARRRRAGRRADLDRRGLGELRELADPAVVQRRDELERARSMAPAWSSRSSPCVDARGTGPPAPAGTHAPSAARIVTRRERSAPGAVA
jgi:hypothetical protein